MEFITKLSHLTTPAILKQTGQVIHSGLDERGNFIITDVTPAYPQGGGQEADIGYIVHNEYTIPFNDVRLCGNSVKHYMPSNYHLPSVGSVVEICVDEIRRISNSIIHTSGHLLASVTFNIQPDLLPSKGHHFRNGSYIELLGDYQGSLDELKTLLQKIIDEEIQTQKLIHTSMVTARELQANCPFIQPGIQMDKDLRIVTIETYFPMGCGGTHVSKLSDIPILTIDKIKYKKGVLRIGYSCF